MKFKGTIKILILVLLSLTFLYQYFRIDKNLSNTIRYKSASEFITSSEVFVNESNKFSNEILEGTMHNRSVLYFQVGLLISLALLEVSWSGSTTTEKIRR